MSGYQALPTPVLKIAFVSDPLSDSPSYTDTTAQGAKIRKVKISRGRSFETERFKAGQFAVTLDNMDRSWESFYSGSPYYPNLLPQKRLQFDVVWDGVTTVPLFGGFIDLPHERYPNIGSAVAELPATDPFGLWSEAVPDDVTFAEDTDGNRIADIADAVGWPGTGLLSSAGFRNISAGFDTIQEQRIRKPRSLLEAAFDVERSCWARFYFDESGVLQYIDRRTTYDRTLTGWDIWGDTTGEYGYTDVERAPSAARIKNRFTGNIAGSATQQTVEDSASILAYGTKAEPVSESLQKSENVNLDLLNYRLHRQKAPAVRIEPLKVKIYQPAPGMPASAQRRALGYKIGDRIIVRKRPPGGGPYWEACVDIEGIDDDISWAPPRAWTRTFHLALSDPNLYWHLGDTVRGLLGSTTRWAA